MKRNILLAIGITLLFLGITVQPAIADNITIYNEKIEKYENNLKVSGFLNIIQFLLDLFEMILNKISQAITNIILIPYYIIIWILIMIILPG